MNLRAAFRMWRRRRRLAALERELEQELRPEQRYRVHRDDELWVLPGYQMERQRVRKRSKR